MEALTDSAMRFLCPFFNIDKDKGKAYITVSRNEWQMREAMLVNVQFEKIVLALGLIIVAVLAVKSLKQFIYLSFTLLSLKVVWVALIILVMILVLKKTGAIRA